MGKTLSNSVMDGGLDKLATANQMSLCEGEPTDRLDAVTPKGSGGKSLGLVTMVGGDFTKSSPTGARRLTVAAKTGISNSDSGNLDHVALVDGTELLCTNTGPTQAVVGGGTTDTSAFNVDFNDPT